MNAFRFISITGLLALFSALVLNVRQNEALIAEAARLQKQTAEIAARLTDADYLAATAERRRVEQKEVARLRARATALAAELEDFGKSRHPPTSRTIAQNSSTAPFALLPGMVRMDASQNSGRDTPEQLFLTLQWALVHGDVTTLLDCIGFDSEGQTMISALYQELSADERRRVRSPERLVALLTKLDNTYAIAAEKGTAYQFVDSRSTTPGEAEIIFRIQDAGKGAHDSPLSMRIRRSPDGWKYLLHFLTLVSLETDLRNMPPTQRVTFGQD